MPPLAAVLTRVRPRVLLAREDVRLNALLAGVILFYALSVQAVAHWHGLLGNVNFYLYSNTSGVAAGLSFVVFVVGYILHLAIVRREPRPLRVIYGDMAGLLRQPAAFFNVIWPLVVIPLFLSSFTSFKSMIPAIHPFSFDPALAALDQALHGGLAPWEITHRLFGSPLATIVINFAYNVWFFLMWVFLFLQLLRINAHRERIRYILTYVLCWAVVGSLFAFLLSSAGPCYFGRVVTDMADPFVPLMERLQAINQPFEAEGSYWGVWALATQDRLWDMAVASETFVGSGISAMPSMHVSIATLMALSAFRLGRLFGWVMTAYAVLIQIGSVHLGWHYALDGYLAAVLTILLWWFSGWLVARVAGRD